MTCAVTCCDPGVGDLATTVRDLYYRPGLPLSAGNSALEDVFGSPQKSKLLATVGYADWPLRSNTKR